MEHKVQYVERVFEFIFQGGFKKKLAELGNPSEDLNIWFKNAQVYEAVTKKKPPTEREKERLVTLIEAVRFEAMYPLPPGEPFEVDLSAYEFSEDLIAKYKEPVINVVLQQESS